jgi:hypothetical protein
MSYDYDFFRVKPNVHSPDELTEENIEPIGTAEEIKTVLTAAFPKTAWWHDSGWLDPDTPMGQVRFADKSISPRHFSVSRINLPEVKRICSALSLVAFDGQKRLLIRPD